MEEAWVEDLLSQCRRAGVAFFMKQLGSVWAKHIGTVDNKGCNWSDLPQHLRVREYPELLEAA